MPTDSQQSTIAELIKNLFKKIFGLSIERGATPSKIKEADNVVDKLDKLSEKVTKETELAKKNNDFVKQVMLERQNICIKSMSSAMGKLANGELSSEEIKNIHNIVAEKSNFDVQEMMNSEDFIFGNSDYLNHDPILVKEKSKEVSDFMAKCTKEIGFGDFENMLNTMLRKETEHTSESFKERPKTHQQQIGMAISNEEEANNKQKLYTNQNDFNKEHYSDPKNQIPSNYSS
ncbi:hypothetical protein [Psychromonas sp. SP041]|uniref:hypothetical protein n=1 Tax=Psychromonas sp. SP041 TaxID=1365007 RepID=UPI0010C77370|nr:hypothetical protein [Psychromonas sp. SP041]